MFYLPVLKRKKQTVITISKAKFKFRILDPWELDTGVWWWWPLGFVPLPASSQGVVVMVRITPSRPWQ